MSAQRTMAQLLQAPTEGYEDAIVVPAITADNFELKHAWIWLEKKPPRSIFTWDDLVSKFINQFFPPSKTTNLPNEITNFQQRFDESFSEAWDRFKDLLRACPHHGFSELHQLDTFYNALILKDQYSLNSAAGVSMNTSTFGISSDVAELKDMVKALLLDKKSQNQSPAPVKAVEESCITCGGAHCYRNCPATDGNVYRNNIQEFISQAFTVNYNQGNTSYRPPMMSNQIRPPGFPPVPNNQNFQLNQRNNQNRFIPNQNRGNNFNKGPIYQPLVFQPPTYQAPAPQTQGVSKEDFQPTSRLMMRLVNNPSSNPTSSMNPNSKGRNHRHSKQRIKNFNLDDLSPPIVTMANQRTMAQLLQAPTENKQFFGHDKEDPHAHVRYFNKTTSTLKFLNVPNTSIKLMIFPFSLKGETQIWLEKEPPRSTFTWDDLVSKFVNQFFPSSKRTNLQLHQLDTFYNALNSKDQDSLNSAAGGQNQSPAPVKAVEKSCVTCGGAYYYRNCPATDGNVYRGNIQEFVSQASAVNYNQGNTSYRPPMMSNQIRPPGFPPVLNNQNVQRNNQNHFIPNQNQGNNFNQRPIYQPSDFQPPAYQAPTYQAPAPQTQGVSKEDFSAYDKANDAFLNSNTASTLSSGTLPSNTIANPRHDLKPITTRNGVSYDGPQIPPPYSSLPKVVEDEPEATKDTVNPTNNRNTKDVQPQEVQSESPILTSKPINSPISELAIAPVSASKPNPKASIPYPSRRNDERNREKANNQIKKFYQIFKDMSFEVSFTDALILMPKFVSTLKALIRNKEKLSEMARTPLNEHCSTILLKKLPKKLGDPGKFLIPCDFPGMAECLALADLGASINLMPFFVWKRLSLPDLTPTCMTLELADRSISHSIRVVEDVYVRVGSFYFSADFVVVDFDADPRAPLILGRSFLKTRRALIDVFEVDEPSVVELKDLPPHLEYLFLEGDDKLPVIIAKDLSTFQWYMMAIFYDMIEKTMKVFMDDFFVFGNSFQSCLSHIERMLKRCEDTNLCLNWEKSHFMVKEGMVLGHKISKQGIVVDKAKVDVITKLPHPITVKGIRSFLGHASFYRRFIKDFSKIARPMTRLLEKDTPFIFSQECVDAFQTLKRKLTVAPILIASNWDMPF
nr:reverse transcriptase domain-containing protein [Tanacetum cinerariifolium]